MVNAADGYIDDDLHVRALDHLNERKLLKYTQANDDAYKNQFQIHFHPTLSSRDPFHIEWRLEWKNVIRLAFGDTEYFSDVSNTWKPKVLFFIKLSISIEKSSIHIGP